MKKYDMLGRGIEFRLENLTRGFGESTQGCSASIVSGTNPQSLGDIPGGGNATATWTLHCDDPGDTNINVTAAGADANTGEPIPDANIDPDSVTVHQAAPGGLSGAAIAGIIAGAIAGAVLIFFALRRWVWKR